MIKIYHNPNCSKSNCALDLLSSREHNVEVVDYQQNPPTENELRYIIQRLGIEPIELMRKGETIFREQYADKMLSDKDCIEAMLAHPILIQRPIVVSDDNVIICRPPERVLEFIAKHA